MSRTSEWAAKVLALVKGGNADAAIAQIKVAPSVKDLLALRAALAASGAARAKQIDIVVAEQVEALSAPRLHRSP